MIAFKTPRKTFTPHVDTPGAATSAAKVNGSVGIRERSHGLEFYVPTEGWVLWAEIEEQVAEAHRAWLARCIDRGYRVWTFRDYWDNQRADAVALLKQAGWRYQRIQWLKIWGERHRQFESIAGLRF